MNCKKTGNKLLDLLLIHLHLKSFARRDAWTNSSHFAYGEKGEAYSLEDFDLYKNKAIGLGLMTKGGAIKPNITKKYWAFRWDQDKERRKYLSDLIEGA